MGESMKTYAEVDRQVIPIIGKCLDGIVKAAESIDQKSVSLPLDFLPRVWSREHSAPCHGDLIQSSPDWSLLSGVRRAPVKKLKSFQIIFSSSSFFIFNQMITELECYHKSQVYL